MSARIAAIVTVVLTTAGCVHSIALNPDHHPVVGTNSYVTFFMLDGNSSGNRAIDREIKSDIESVLANRGLIATSPEEAEAVVVAHTATAQTHSEDAFYNGWGGWDWRRNAAGAPIADIYRPGTLIVDVFDAGTKNLVWHFAAPHAVADTETADAGKLDETITRMLEGVNWPTASWRDTAANVVSAEPNIAADQTPRIIFSSEPAVLIRIDGEPVYATVEGTRLQRVTNTKSLILRDESSTYYLKLDDRWLEAYDLIGPWSIAATLPDAAKKFGASSGEYGVGVETSGPLPQVYIATTPTELIVTTGEPRFAAVGDSRLTRMTNTTARVFREPTDRELYVDLSGTWLRSWTLGGPWQEISTERLPADLKELMKTKFI